MTYATRKSRATTVSDAEYRRRMLDATAQLYDALQKLGPGRRLTIDRQPDGRLRCADYDVQGALREIEAFEPAAVGGPIS